MGNKDVVNLHWTEAVSEECLLEKLLASVNAVIYEQTGRINNIRLNLQLYEDSEAHIRGDSSLNCRFSQLGGDDRDKIDGHGYNVIRVCVNTLTNKIGKNKVNPRVLITGAPYLIREKAKKADTFLKEVFKKLEVRKHAKTALYDACLHGTGLVKVCNDGKDVWVERAMPDEVFVELADGYRGNPSRVYELRYMSRSSVAKMVEGDKIKEMQVMTADSIPFSSMAHQTAQIDSISRFGNLNSQKDENIIVIEAWEVAKSEDEPGRHVIAVGNCIILDEAWTRDYLPFIKIDYNEPLVGWYSTGIAHELHYAQKDLVEMDNLINESIISMTAPKLLVNGDAEIRTEEFDNIPGSIIRIGGITPGVALQTVVAPLTPQAISGEVYGYREGKIKDAHDQSGISQMSASGQKPSGLDSGVALREFNDIQTERFALLGQAWEDAHKNIAEMVFKEMLLLGNYVIRQRRGSSLRTVKLSDLGLNIDDIEVSVYPISALPDSPSGRLQTINEWVAAQLITPQEAAELMEMPDLEGYNELHNAPKRAVDRLIDRIMNNPYMNITINPYMDLDYLLQRCMLFYNYVLAEIDDDSFEEQIKGDDINEEMGDLMDDTFTDEEEPEEVEEEVEDYKEDRTPKGIANQLLNTFIRLAEECKTIIEEEMAKSQPPPQELPPAGMPMGDPAMGGLDENAMMMMDAPPPMM